MGSMSNWMEALGGEHFNIKDLARAKVTYWKDIRGIMGDMSGARHVNTSATNFNH